MTVLRIAFAAAAALSIALGSSAEAAKAASGGGSEKGKEAAPPQPRVVEPYAKPGLPPREADPSWVLYQEGSRLFAEKRLGEAIDSLKRAVEARSQLFGRCAEDVDAALAAKEAKKARDSLAGLVRLLAARDLIPQDIDAILGRSGGSIVTEMRLLRERTPSSPLRGLIDAALLVVEERGLSRIGDSLAGLRKEVGLLARYPEAEFMIGEAYLAEGELRLADLQLSAACDMKDSLEIPEARFGMLATLAGVHKSMGDAKRYEADLRQIADASDLFASKDDRYRSSMERTLGERGFDRFMEYFRVEQVFAIGAYSSLGELYLGDGRTIATIYLAAAVNAVLTRAIAETRIDEPSYDFAGLRDILSRIGSDPKLAAFAADSDLWKDLKLLGDSLAASGYRDTAKEIWAAMRDAGAPEPWRRRAAAELAGPVNASRTP